MSNKALFVDAMRSQPESLALALSTLTSDLAQAKIEPWKPTDTIAVVAMGASGHSGAALVSVLIAAGFRATNVVASDLAAAPEGYQPADHYVIVSESGRSPETIDAARGLTVGRRIGISNFPNAQISDVVDVRLGLGGFDDSPVYTVGYTATLLAYALLLDRVGILPINPDVGRVPELVSAALHDFDTIAAAVGAIFASASSIDVIGRGTSYASASEAALMIREALRTPSTAFETYQYLHGPMESMSDGHALLVFGDGRELTVPDSVLDAGVKVILVTAAAAKDVPSHGHPNLTIVPIDGALSEFARPIVEIVFAQLALAHAAEHQSFPIEKFLYEQHDTKISES
ncbi:MAG: SIS domain-containing protein [Rhodoglobus sp.]